MIKRETGLGNIYQQTGDTYLGHRGPSWIVAEVFTALDGLPHAILVNIADSSRRKTVAVDALRNPRLYSVQH